MSNRIALFSLKEEIEDYFGFQTGKRSIFEPRYNIAPAQQLAVICRENGETLIRQCRWGLSGEDHKPSSEIVDIEQSLPGLKDGSLGRCIIPASGYYKWKSAGKRSEFPFFIRLLDEPVMALAGVFLPGAGETGSEPCRCALIQTQANALIQPLDPKMPLQLDRELTAAWLDAGKDPGQVIESARKLFWMTEMTVLRVSKKVNDLTQNSPRLIQPLPK